MNAHDHTSDSDCGGSNGGSALAQRPSAGTSTELALRLLASNGVLCAVAFVKRSTGELRQMNCRCTSTMQRQGDRRFNPLERGLVTVFDEEKQEFRSVPIEGIRQLAINGAILSAE